MSDAKVILGDCLDVLPRMEPDSVDLVFCSPPYEAARDYGIGFKLRGEDWVEWALPRYRECLRVCRGLVAWVVAGKTRNFSWSATPALLIADLKRAGVTMRNPPIYRRFSIPGSGGPEWLREDFEWIICATNGGKLPWSDNTAMGHPPLWAPGGDMSHRLSDGKRVNQWGGSAKSTGGERKRNGKLKQATPKPSHIFTTKRQLRKGGSRRGKDDERRDHGYTLPAIANPGNVITCKVGGGLMGSKLAHENEAPFPESLAEFFIRSFCPPGGTVLDPFSGSGTTASVAVRLGREAIAIDVRESQCELTRRRLEQTQLVFADAESER